MEKNDVKSAKEEKKKYLVTFLKNRTKYGVKIDCLIKLADNLIFQDKQSRVNEVMFENACIDLNQSLSTNKLEFNSAIDFFTGLNKNEKSYYLLRVPYCIYLNEDGSKKLGCVGFFLAPEFVQNLKKKGLQFPWQAKKIEEIDNIDLDL